MLKMQPNKRIQTDRGGTAAADALRSAWVQRFIM
jgi:hypothetical protein